MPVVPYCSSLCQDVQAVQPFINECLGQVAQGRGVTIASLSFPLPPVDPLLVLARLVPNPDRYVYLEQSSVGESVVAWGSALVYQATGQGRFGEAQRFINQWQPRIRCYGQVPSSSAANTPRFFCSFTFFSQSLRGKLDFPAATVLLPEWQVLRRGQSHTLTVNLRLTADTRLEAVLDDLDHCITALQNLANGDYTAMPTLPLDLVRWPSAVAMQQFQDSVERALRHIDQHQIQKIVLAHAFDVVRDSPFQPLPSLDHLRRRYPDCYVFAVGNGQGTTFMGASPERLLSIRQRQLMTDALAGSAPRGSTGSEDRQLAQRLLHSPKEQGEHQLVVSFIAQKLAGLGLQPEYPSCPTLLRLSNIQHLHTPIQTKLLGPVHPLQLVEALHPTPAVAGVPTAAACAQIHHYERFDRGLYAAPLGWVGANGDSEFIVGIRSALINDNWARLYAGAGIVAGSNPEREWAEINLKFRALGESLV